MSIQAVNSTASLWQTMKADLKTLRQSLAASQSAQQSGGNQDQVTISQDALQKAAAALLSDITNIQSASTDASGNSTSGSSSTSNTNSSPFQALTQDLTNLQSAMQSGDQSKIQSAENTLGTDLSALHRGHHHHHHHGGAQSLFSLNSTGNDSTTSLSTGGTSTSAGTAQ